MNYNVISNKGYISPNNHWMSKSKGIIDIQVVVSDEGTNTGLFRDKSWNFKTYDTPQPESSTLRLILWLVYSCVGL